MNKTYVIVSPVYNEEKYIAKTIESVLAQSLLPTAWIIVDDDSTDRTSEIIKSYSRRYSWIKYVLRRKDTGQSYYASNVYAIQQGTDLCGEMSYNYLAILDGDISLPLDYYQRILHWMDTDTRIGIASGVYQDNVDGKLREVLNDRRSTPKALMVFRKQCYQDIGGFIPLKYGGEDTCACFMARMKNWKTWSFPNLMAVHNKPIGTGHTKNILQIRFRQGIEEYFLATQPVFFLLKSLRRCLRENPPILGGSARILGYAKGVFMAEKRQIPDDLVRYIHKEQLYRVLKGNTIPAEFRVDTSI